MSRGTWVPPRADLPFMYGAFTLYGRPSQAFPLGITVPRRWSHNPMPASRHGLGYSRFAHHYSGNRFFFLFLWVLRCFSSPRSLPTPMYSAQDTLAGGFPHSDISGSKIAPISPKLFAGCHVLHRLLSPRHPPGALIALENPHTQTPLMTLEMQY